MMFCNRVMRKKTGPKAEEVPGGWKILHNDELNDRYSSANIIHGIKSSRMRLEGNVTSTEEKEVYKEFY
jgi:hypothetical protein